MIGDRCRRIHGITSRFLRATMAELRSSVDIYIYIRRNKAHRGEGKREEEVEDSKERRGEETRSKRVDRRVGTKGTHNRYSPADSLSLSLSLCDLAWLIIPRTENGNWPAEPNNLMLAREPPRPFRR